MEGVICRLLPYAVADGPQNMAADEVLLESAAAGVASLRFYGWSQATLSLGYFQPHRLRLEDARLAALPYVRRPTGGDALVHHHELTYAIGLPAGSHWQPPGARASSSLSRMHDIIAGALGSLGVAVGAHGDVGKKRDTRSELLLSPRSGGPLCFEHLTPGDLLIGSAKVVGSSQRRQRGALLQHGGILLGASAHTPALPGILELAGKRLAAGAVRQAVVLELAQQTGWRLREADWALPERHRMRCLVDRKYGCDPWTHRR